MKLDPFEGRIPVTAAEQIHALEKALKTKGTRRLIANLRRDIMASVLELSPPHTEMITHELICTRCGDQVLATLPKHMDVTLNLPCTSDKCIAFTLLDVWERLEEQCDLIMTEKGIPADDDE